MRKHNWNIGIFARNNVTADSRHAGLLRRLAMTSLTSLLLCSSAPAFEPDPYPFNSQVDKQRFEALTKEIRCVVCQNQAIAESNAPLAKDLRTKVYQLIKDQRSNADIKTYLVDRYGEFILLRPRFTQTTALLWLLPVGILLFTCLLFVRFVRKFS